VCVWVCVCMCVCVVTDLMLLHWPCKTGRVEDTQAAWLGLQRALQKKLVRAIGVRYIYPIPYTLPSPPLSVSRP